VVALLSGLSTTPAQGYSASCDGRLPVAGADDSVQLAVHVLYPSGRSVVIIPFLGCDPALSNGSLAAQASAAEQEELLRLLR
jgi:hypothetical protein